MNWKNRYSELKIGDKVKLIKFNEDATCNDENCCESHGYYIGCIYTIHNILLNNPHTYRINNPDGRGGCGFPKDCLQKVY